MPSPLIIGDRKGLNIAGFMYIVSYLIVFMQELGLRTRPGNQVAAEGAHAGRTAVGTRLKRDEVSRSQLSHGERAALDYQETGWFRFFTLIPSSSLYSPLPNRISCYTSLKFLKKKTISIPQKGLLNVEIRILCSY